MIREVGLTALIIGAWFGIRWLLKQPRNVQWRWVGICAIIILLGLVVTGKMHWIFAAVAAAVPIIRRLFGLISYFPLLRGFLRRSNASAQGFSSSRPSSIETRFLKVTLDPVSGSLFGEIKQGLYQGRKLQDLSSQELSELLKEYTRADPQSAQLLSAYLARSGYAGSHRQHGQHGTGKSSASSRGSMTRQEAYAILGLDEGACEKEILEAHRRLIQKLHPDRGGNDYLAAKINQAKQTLLA